MTTREELVALADEARKRNEIHRDKTGDMMCLGRPDDFLTSVEGALRHLASRQEVSVEQPHPSDEAMKAAVELEIHAALGQVQTVVIGRLIQKAIDASLAKHFITNRS